jgi:hypothetical protein
MTSLCHVCPPSVPDVLAFFGMSVAHRVCHVMLTWWRSYCNLLVMNQFCMQVAIASEYLHLQGWKQHFPSKLCYPPTRLQTITHKATTCTSKCSSLNTMPLIRNMFIHQQLSSVIRYCLRRYRSGWGIMLQGGRSPFQFPMRSMNFFNLPNSSSRTIAFGFVRL